jgi:DNA polymerase/3'-5' exonuclease PolX
MTAAAAATPATAVLTLAQARAVGTALTARMVPLCEPNRCVVAGSTRRNKDGSIKDVEVCVIPRREDRLDPADLFGERTVSVNLLHAWATKEALDAEGRPCPVRWIKPNTDALMDWTPDPHGKYWRGLVRHKGIELPVKLDVFLATPENWGCILIIRTGSRDFGEALMTFARTRGMRFDGGFLWRQETRLLSAEESDVFRALGLAFIEPPDRINDQSLRKAVLRRSGGDQQRTTSTGGGRLPAVNTRQCHP